MLFGTVFTGDYLVIISGNLQKHFS